MQPLCRCGRKDGQTRTDCVSFGSKRVRGLRPWAHLKSKTFPAIRHTHTETHTHQPRVATATLSRRLEEFLQTCAERRFCSSTPPPPS